MLFNINIFERSKPTSQWSEVFFKLSLTNNKCWLEKKKKIHIHYMSNPSLSPNYWCQRSWGWLVLWRPTIPSKTNTNIYVIFIIGDWTANVGCESIPGVTSKFDLGVQNETGQRISEFCQENTLVIANTLSNNARDDFAYGHHQMVNVKIRLITLFAAKNREALYSQQKQDQELTVAQIMNSLLPNSDSNWRK